ncbi:hypothetical protein GLP30_17110 [Photobacterium phosphoreum]|uniref:hypothetical protein n=1 Tax=Photobacterium phosphoreum TaxID=659 RepID=UPI001E4A561B|nr:hypothetical protein [Photobacterium phosphoreum]MCD9492627.1 hypothetical protein [Photobacterium phosphoreum]MCF2191808.1 hypothetical protein [Photobacterium phosphoreum]
MQKETTPYLSYNALARKSLVWGVPLLLGLALLALIIITTFISVWIGSLLFATIPLSLIMLIFAIKFISETDSMAVDKTKWFLKGLMIRVKYRSLHLIITSRTNSDNKKERINDFFKQYRSK